MKNYTRDHDDGRDFAVICSPVILNKMRFHGYLYTLHPTNEEPFTTCTKADFYTAILYTRESQAVVHAGPERSLNWLLSVIPFKPNGGQRSASCLVQ